jgi:hypothetical protein
MGGKSVEKKKPYKRPTVAKVRLDVKSSVLAACFTSTNLSPDIGGCQTVASNCVQP